MAEGNAEKMPADLALIGMAGGESAHAIALHVPERDGWTQLGHLLACLIVLGLPVCLEARFENRGRAASSVTEFIDQRRRMASPKATDLLLGPNKASPISPFLPTPTKESKADADDGQGTTAEAKMATTNGEQIIGWPDAREKAVGVRY